MSLGKINLSFTSQESWQHHRSGWRACLAAMQSLHHRSGTPCFGWLDAYINEPISHSFVGFLHNTPHHPIHYHQKYSKIPSLEAGLSSEIWRANEQRCKGIFSLSEYTAEFIRSLTNVPVSVVPHPIDVTPVHFSMNAFQSNPRKQIVMIGHWMRKFEDFFEVQCPYDKVILRCNSIPDVPEGISIQDWVPHDEYDRLLSRNVVFLSLFDVAACNTILDCISRNTPLFVNDLPAAIEYLGKDYPLFYKEISQVPRMITLEKIEEAHRYLAAMDKSRFDIERFVSMVSESEVYRRLPVARIF